MATKKLSTPRKAERAEPAPQITPMPFPGESPTVSLAMAAGEKFGFHEDAKPAKAKRKTTAKAKKPSRPASKGAGVRKAAPRSRAGR